MICKTGRDRAHHRQVPTNLTGSAARQQQHRPPSRHRLPGRQRGHGGMTDIGRRRSAELCHHRRLERKDREHLVEDLAQASGPFGLPSPDGGRDIEDQRHLPPLPADGFGDDFGKDLRVDEDDDLRLRPNDLARHLSGTP